MKELSKIVFGSISIDDLINMVWLLEQLDEEYEKILGFEDLNEEEKKDVLNFVSEIVSEFSEEYGDVLAKIAEKVRKESQKKLEENK